MTESPTMEYGPYPNPIENKKIILQSYCSENFCPVLFLKMWHLILRIFLLISVSWKGDFYFILYIMKIYFTNTDLDDVILPRFWTCDKPRIWILMWNSSFEICIARHWILRFSLTLVITSSIDGSCLHHHRILLI